jgi:hypothetical protein
MSRQAELLCLALRAKNRQRGGRCDRHHLSSLAVPRSPAGTQNRPRRRRQRRAQLASTQRIRSLFPGGGYAFGSATVSIFGVSALHAFRALLYRLAPSI